MSPEKKQQLAAMKYLAKLYPKKYRIRGEWSFYGSSYGVSLDEYKDKGWWDVHTLVFYMKKEEKEEFQVYEFMA